MYKFTVEDGGKPRKISLPEKWGEVTLGMLIDMAEMQLLPEDERTFTRTLSILTGEDEKTFRAAAIGDVHQMRGYLWWLKADEFFKTAPEPVDSFILKGVTYHVTPDPGRSTWGQIEDAKNLLMQEVDMTTYIHKLLAIYCLPVQIKQRFPWSRAKKVIASYDYDESLIRAEVFRGLDAVTSWGLARFFLNKLEASMKRSAGGGSLKKSANTRWKKMLPAFTNLKRGVFIKRLHIFIIMMF